MSSTVSMSGLLNVDVMGRPVQTGRLPNTDDAAALPRALRKDFKRLASFYVTQHRQSNLVRRRHAEQWMRVLSIMAGVHWFRVDAGRWQPLAQKGGQIRARAPLMVPAYRREMGRLTNQIGVTALPTATSNRDSFLRASRAQAIMEAWAREIDIQRFDDEQNQQLLVFGMSAIMRYVDPIDQQVRLKAISGSELFPIPYDASTWADQDGVGRAVLVSEQWLEMQDELFERKNGKKPTRPMAGLAGVHTTSMHANFAGFGVGSELGGKMKGALATWIWMKPNQLNPAGEHLFLVGEELFGYVSGRDEEGVSLALPHGGIPMVPVYYRKDPRDWWGYGFCEELIGPQMELNRQLTRMLRNAKRSGGFVAYNTTLITGNKVHQDSEGGFVGFQDPGYQQNRIPPVIAIPPQGVGPDTINLLGFVQRLGDIAAGHESPIVRGVQSGRTEGGPATSLLADAAGVQISPVFAYKKSAYMESFPLILDMIGKVWPKDKKILVHGDGNLGEELLIGENDRPTSKDVLLTPTPLLPNGQQTLLSLAFRLRAMPGEDGSFELKSHELRRALTLLGMTIPGLDMYDEEEVRIQWRIAELIGDGQQPTTIPLGEMDPQTGQPVGGEAELEDHEKAMGMLKSKILGPAYSRIYGPAVKAALLAEFKFHKNLLGGVVREPDTFDDELEQADRSQFENTLETLENQPDTPAGLAALI